MANSALIAIFLILLVTCANCSEKKEKCQRVNACKCEISSYETIDISGLISDKNVPLEDSDHHSNFTYYFFGCADGIVHNNTGSLIRLNEIRNNGTSYNYTVLGNSSNGKFEVSADSMAYDLVFSNGSNVTASIRLLCDDYDTPFLKVLDPVHNQFVVSSPAVCIRKESSGMSSTSIFFLLLLITFVLYFVCGGLIMYFLRGARGLEVIPNIEFWSRVPTHLKNGTIYILSGCRPTYVTTEETYDRI